jgi:hypothetical protein
MLATKEIPLCHTAATAFDGAFYIRRAATLSAEIREARDTYIVREATKNKPILAGGSIGIDFPFAIWRATVLHS